MFAVSYHEGWSDKLWAGTFAGLTEVAKFLQAEAALGEFSVPRIEDGLRKLMGKGDSPITFSTESDDNGGNVILFPLPASPGERAGPFKVEGAAPEIRTLLRSIPERPRQKTQRERLDEIADKLGLRSDWELRRFEGRGELLGYIGSENREAYFGDHPVQADEGEADDIGDNNIPVSILLSPRPGKFIIEGYLEDSSGDPDSPGIPVQIELDLRLVLKSQEIKELREALQKIQSAPAARRA